MEVLWEPPVSTPTLQQEHKEQQGLCLIVTNLLFLSYFVLPELKKKCN